MIVVGIVLLVVQTLSAAPSVTNMTDYYAQKLNRTRLDYEAFSGYEPIDWYFDNGNIFYTYWGYNNGSMNSTDTKLIVFLQGGPGASGQFSAFNYIGPLRVVRNSNDSSKMHLESNIHGWNSIGNLLVVDQPFGVGFSYEQNNKIVSSTEEAANYFVNFMYNFKKTWNITTQQVYLTGESFAGHYVPVFTQYLMSNRSLSLQIKGISIGGPYIQSYIQDNYFDSFLTSFGIIDDGVSRLVQHHMMESMVHIRFNRFAQAAHEMNKISDDENFFEEYYNGINIFNVKQYDEGNCNYDYDVYMESIKTDMKIVPKNISFVDTNDAVYEAFSADLAESKEAALLYCIGRIKVSLYVGQNDAVVSSPGLQTFLNSWSWPMKEGWKRVPKEFLKLGGQIVGWKKKYGRLQLTIFNNAGHFVPADQPLAFHAYFREWIIS